MIGDWVLTLESTHKEKVYAQIWAIEEGQTSILVKKDNCNWFVDIEWIEPIPLTPEILEKNGFRHGCYVGGYYSPDCPFRVFTKTEGTCGFTTLFDDEIHFSCIFVHQLQHALSLCGIEKEITI